MAVKTDVIQSVNPADESVIEEIPVTDTEAVETLIDNASTAESEWSERPLDERIDLILQAASAIDDRTEELAETLTREQGKPLFESRREVSNAAERLRYFCDRAPDLLIPERIPVNDSLTGVVHPRPYGVVAAIKPWNFPVNLPCWTLGPALLAGNTVVFKPSELTPVTGRKLVECFPDELSENNVLNLVQGSGEVGRTLVENENVDYVSFIGSRQTGQWIYRASAEHLHGISLELGGKDPMIVLEDADIDRAIDDLLHGAFKNCGQVCCGIERCLVPSDVFDEFCEKISERIQDLVVGDGFDQSTDVGPMVRETERERVKEHLRDAENRGAEITYCKNLPDKEHGFWQAPALVQNVTTDMKLLNEETFGPVLPVLSYDRESEAIEEANRLDFGLSACVYSGDPDHAREVASELDAGSIGINQVVGSIVELPWGGVKMSGVGRMLDEEGILTFTQSVTERWNPEELEELA